MGNGSKYQLRYIKQNKKQSRGRAYITKLQNGEKLTNQYNAIRNKRAYKKKVLKTKNRKGKKKKIQILKRLKIIKKKTRIQLQRQDVTCTDCLASMVSSLKLEFTLVRNFLAQRSRINIKFERMGK